MRCSTAIRLAPANETGIIVVNTHSPLNAIAIQTGRHGMADGPNLLWSHARRLTHHL
jgi:hypothetical protein